jgi:hypothetical protein
MQRSDQTDVRRALLGGDHLEDVCNAELGFTPTDQRDQDRLACGRLHHDVEVGLFLEHLGDRRTRRVVERPRLHGGKAVGLRGGDVRTEQDRGETDGDGNRSENRQS